MISVLVSQSGGFAIASIDETLLLFRGKRGEVVERIDELTAASMLARCIDIEPVSALDIDAIRAHLALRGEREELLHATLIAIDTARTDDLRRSAMAFLDKHVESDQWTWIEGVLASSPFPNEVDVAWASNWVHPLAKILARLMQRRDQVRLVSAVWDALPEELFASEFRSHIRCKLVRQGVFGLLYTGDNHARTGPFRESLHHFSSAISALSAPTQNPSVASLYLSSPQTPMVGLSQELQQIWSVAPWRAAWLGSEWQTTRARLACDAADVWSDPISRAMRSKVPISGNIRLATLYETWHEVRHLSAFTESLDLMVALTQGREVEGMLIDDVKQKLHLSSVPTSMRRYLPSKLGRFLKTVAGIDPDGLLKLTRAFFGVGQSPDQKFQMLIRKTLSSSDLLDISRAHVFAHCMQLRFDTTVPLNCRINAEHAAATDSSMTQFKSMLELHALEETFSAGGFLVVNVSSGSASHAPRAYLRTACVDLAGRRSFTFEGSRAMLLSILGERLVTDLKSGLPTERCGWIYFGELAASLRLPEEKVKETLEQMGRQVSEAKFSSDALQTALDRARLNPAAATAAGPANLARVPRQGGQWPESRS